MYVISLSLSPHTAETHTFLLFSDFAGEGNDQRILCLLLSYIHPFVRKEKARERERAESKNIASLGVTLDFQFTLFK